MKKKLLKDLIIPAGTIFTDAPQKTVRSSGFGETIIGLTDDSSGSVVYDIEGDDAEKLKEWFVDVE